MKDGFFTKDSMFIEFIEVMEYLKTKDLDTKDELPAMIILEKQKDGMNKHGIIGRPIEVITLLEWGISQYAEQYDISFEDMMSFIQKKHDCTEHLVLFSDKE